MKWGILVSVLLVAAIGIMAIVTMRGSSDDPTDISSEQALRQRQLPSLPLAYQGGTGNGDAAHAALIAYYLDNDWKILPKNQRADPEPECLLKTAELLIEAMNAGDPRRGWLDETLETRILTASPQNGAVMAIAQAMLAGPASVFHSALAGGNRARAEAVARAVFALGHRAFTLNDMLVARAGGLEIMRGATGLLAGKLDDANAGQWDPALTELRSAWNAKLQAIAAPRYKDYSNLADVTRIATLDQDPSWRIEATTTLAYHKFRLGDRRGNQRLVDDALAKARKDPHPLVRKAAVYADEFTREKYRQGFQQ